MSVGVRFQLRADTAANWTANNPTLASAEPAVESDTKKWKVGDGATAWASLPYFGASGTVPGSASLPSSPVDGQLFSLLVDDTNGVEWLMRWDAAKSLWRCIGGNPLTAYVASVNSGTAQAVTTSFVAVTGGPSLVLPNVGTALDVVFDHGVTWFGSTSTNGVQASLALSIGGVAPRATDPVIQDYSSGSTAIGWRTSSTRGPIESAAGGGAVTPGATITQQIKGSAANATGFQMTQAFISARCLQIHP